MIGKQITDGERQALLAQPTAMVAAAIRDDLPMVSGLALAAPLREWLAGELAAATGSAAWQLEHLREHRPLAEFLDVARLVTAQRRLYQAA